MRTLATLLPFFLLAITASGQDAECPPIDTVAVIQMDGVSANDLYERSRRWFATTFTDSKEVIQLEDPANFTIVGKGSTQLNERSVMLFTIEVACKDGRYRVELRDVEHKGVGGSTYGGKYFPSPSYGSFYRCSICCDGYRKYLAENSGKEGFNPNVCLRLPKELSKAMSSVLASLDSGMNKVIAKDW